MDNASHRTLMSEEERRLILQEFPTPIATACSELWDAMGLLSSKQGASQDVSLSLSEALEKAFESLLRFCAWTVTSDYLELQKDWSSDKLDRQILQFFAESRSHGRNRIGNWMTLFKDVLRGLLNRPRPLFVKEVARRGTLDAGEKSDEPKTQVETWFGRLESFRRIGDMERHGDAALADVDEMLRLFHEILKSVFWLKNYRLLATLKDPATSPDSFMTVVFQGIAPYEKEVSLQRRDRHQEIEQKTTYLVDAENGALRLTPLIALQGTHSICTYVEALDRGDYIYEPGRITMKDEETLRLISYFIDLMERREEKSRTEHAATDATVACQVNCQEFLQRKRKQGYERTLYQPRELQETILTFLEKGPTPRGEPFSEPVMVLVGPSGVGKSMLLCNLLANRPGGRLTLAYDAREIKEGIVKAAMKSLGLPGESDPRMLLEHLDAFQRGRPDVFSKKSPMAIVVDGLNEADDYNTVFPSIHELASQIDDRPIRIVLTSRPTIWRRIQRDWNRNGEFEGLYYRSGSDAGDPLSYALQLRPFSPRELQEAYERYCSQKGSHLPPFAGLPHEWKALLRSPFYLPLIVSQARREGRLPDIVSRASAIEEYLRVRVGELEGKDTGGDVSLSKMQEVLVRLARLMLEHRCLSIARASGGEAIKEAVHNILYEYGEPYALAIDVGIIEERGGRLGAFEIHFTHEQFTEYYFAQALRSQLDQITGPPDDRAQMWARRMVELLANTPMIAVLSGAFIMLISAVKDPAFVELLLRSLASHDAPEISEVVVQSLVRLCEQDWSKGERILCAMIAGSPRTGLSRLRKGMDSLRHLITRDVVAQDHARMTANTSDRCRRATVEAGTLVEGNQPNAFLIDALQDRSAIVRNFAVDLVSGRWCAANTSEREVFLADLAKVLEFPEAGMAGTLWHAFKKRRLLQSGGRFLFASYVEDVQNAERSGQILDCCQRILGKVPPSLLPRLSKLLVGPAFFVIERFSMFPLRSISILWNKGNVNQTHGLVEFIDPKACPAPDAIKRIDEILLTGGRDRMRLGMRWLAIVAYSGYAVNKPEEAAQHFRQLQERGDEFVRYYLLVPATFGWQGNQSSALKSLVEETCWRIMTEWRQDMYLAESPWFTCGTPLTPLSIFGWRVTEDPSAPLLIFKRAMEEFCSKQKNPTVTTRLLEDITPLLLACPSAVVPILISYPELLDARLAGADFVMEAQWRPVVNRFCELLATLRLSNSRALEDFLEASQPPASFVSQLQRTNPNPTYLTISRSMRLGRSTQRLLITPNAMSHWFISAIKAVCSEGSMHKHVAHFAADMVVCLQAGSLAQSDFLISGTGDKR